MWEFSNKGVHNRQTWGFAAGVELDSTVICSLRAIQRAKNDNWAKKKLR